MPTIPFKRTLVFMGLILALTGAAFSIPGSPPGRRTKIRKERCLDCHKKFSEKYLSLKSLHPGMKEDKCENSTFGTGSSQASVEKDGNELCFTCHAKEKIGLNQPTSTRS